MGVCAAPGAVSETGPSDSGALRVAPGQHHGFCEEVERRGKRNGRYSAADFLGQHAQFETPKPRAAVFFRYRRAQPAQLRRAFPQRCVEGDALVVEHGGSEKRIAFDEIRQYGKESIQVLRRLRAALLDLRAVCPPARCGVLDLELRELDKAARQLDAAPDRALAARPSAQGQGA